MSATSPPFAWVISGYFAGAKTSRLLRGRKYYLVWLSEGWPQINSFRWPALWPWVYPSCVIQESGRATLSGSAARLVVLKLQINQARWYHARFWTSGLGRFSNLLISESSMRFQSGLQTRQVMAVAWLGALKSTKNRKSSVFNYGKWLKP